MTDEITKLLDRITASYEGCECECTPERLDDDGNKIEAHECLPCNARRVSDLWFLDYDTLEMPAIRERG